MTEDEVLDVLTRTGALLSGHFELRSGLHSDRYFQCANLLRYPQESARLCREVANGLQTVDGFRETVDAVISPAMGGIIVGHEVARALGVMSIFAEKVDDRLTLRRFRIEPGAHYVVAEDVITRGGRVQETIDIVTAGGGTVAGVAVLVDRSAGTVEFGVPFHSLLRLAPTVWDAGACPLCRDGLPIEHPGS